MFWLEVSLDSVGRKVVGCDVEAIYLSPLGVEFTSCSKLFIITILQIVGTHHFQSGHCYLLTFKAYISEV